MTFPGTPRRWLLVVGTVVAAVLVVVLVFRSRRQPEMEDRVFDLDAGLRVATVTPVSGSDPAVGVRKLWVIRRGERTAWDYHILCVDSQGCIGRVELTFRFRAEGRRRQHGVVREIALRRGETLHDAFTMRPGLHVDAVDGVEIRFLERHETPRPTPTRTE